MSRPTPQLQRRRDRRAAARLERAPKARTRTRAAGRPAWQSPVVLVTAAAIVIGAVLIALALPKGPSGAALQPPPTTYEPGLATGDVLGSASAPVVMELYSDFQCPACKLLVTTQMPSLLNDFVRPGTLRIEAHDIAFLGRGSPDESLELAAGAVCAAEQDRYWQYHDYVFWNQGRENKGDHSADFIKRVAAAAGLAAATFEACLARDDVRKGVKSATAVASGAGIGSTPTLVINGQKLVGVKDYTVVASLIRQLASPAPSGGESTTAPTIAPS